jgi:hypothetical protein
VSKNKALAAAYLALIIAISVANELLLFAFVAIGSLLILQKGRQKVIFRRSFLAVAFFSGLTFVGALAASAIFGVKADFAHIGILFCRSFSSVFLTLSLVDRVGIFNIFSAKNELSIFFVMLFSKIESLKKEMQEFGEAARSRGLRMDSMKESLTLLSIVVTALLLKSLEGFRTSAEALKSRGHGA